jgi:hypothetical protein
MSPRFRLAGVIICAGTALALTLFGLTNFSKSVEASPDEKLEPQVKRELEEIRRKKARSLPEMRNVRIRKGKHKTKMSRNAYGKWEFIPASELKSTLKKAIRPRALNKNRIDTYVIRKRIKVLVADYEGTGDVINLILNDKFYPDVVLDSSYQIFDMDLEPGANSILIRGESQGTPLDYITPELRLLSTELLEGEENGPFQSLILPGDIAALDTIAFPQIGMSRSRFPNSVMHMQDAWKGTDSDFRPALPKVAPKLLTLDRDGAESRREYNLRPPVPAKKRCLGVTINPNTGKPERDEVDEWPPAVTRESAAPIAENRRAHLRCIPAWDNGGSGASFARQFNSYLPRSTSRKRYTVPDNGVIEFVVTP